MTETQGDYLGCAIVLLGLVPMLLAVSQASAGRFGRARMLLGLNLILSIVGVATVILT